MFKKKRKKKVKKAVELPVSRKKTVLHKTYAQIGAEGEQRIYGSLVQLFGINAVFKNVYIRRPSGRLTEIDLLAVHSTGVYVVESKNYAGMVTGNGYANEWVHTKGNDYKRSFYSPVAQNRGHIEALREACQLHFNFTPPMLSLLVFPDKCELKITNLPAGLRCCRLSRLPEVISEVVKVVQPALNPTQIFLLSSLFYQSQRHLLPAKIQAQHMKDVAAAKRWVKHN